MLRMIAAMDVQRGLADEHGIPWQGRIPTDTERFHELTTSGIIVMGYATYEEYDKPLHDRENFVVARPDSGALRPGFVQIPDANMFLDEHANELVWVIGGAALFAATLTRGEQLYLTRIDSDFRCTKFFPDFSDRFHLSTDEGTHTENGITFHFEIWRRSPAE
jgi:dihydrofolate reductase